MGTLAGLLKSAGHRVTGSDRSFYPPMGPALEEWGVETRPGWDPANLQPEPDLVVVGNVCRRDNPEARAAIDGGMRYLSMPAALSELFIGDRASLVVAGTHGKTTSTAILAHLLTETHQDPGYLVGGVPRSAPSFRVGTGPFVVEGDEYDTAFFEKTPKFWHYRTNAVLLTSAEHDHIDIYPDEASYLAAFEGLIARLPADGLLMAYAGDPRVCALARSAPCQVRSYALMDDPVADTAPLWCGSLYRGPVDADGSAALAMDIYGGGSFCGRVQLPLAGRHNARNALGALALCAELGSSDKFGAAHLDADLASLMRALPTFGGVRRRQDLLATIREPGTRGDGRLATRIYDDFAHHPSAVRETLLGLKSRHPNRRLIAVFEPRSATASRRLHQSAYVNAFAPADAVVLAPVGRKDIPVDDRLDTHRLARALDDPQNGKRATACDDADAVVQAARAWVEPGDTVVFMSNGDFAQIPHRMILALAARSLTSGSATATREGSDR